MSADLQKVFEQLPENFFGTVEISFQNGRPHIARVTQTHQLFRASKLQSRENRGESNVRFTGQR